MIYSTLKIDIVSGGILEADQTFRTWVSDNDIQNSSIDNYFASADSESFSEKLKSHLENAEPAVLNAIPLFRTELFDNTIVYLPHPASDNSGQPTLTFYPIQNQSVRSLEQLQLPQQLFDAIPDFILICAPDYTILRANPATQWVFGAGKKLNGKKCYEVLRDKTAPCEDCPLPATLKNNEITPIEFYDTERGEFFELRTYPAKDENDLLQGFTIIDRLISSRQKQEMEVTRDKKLQALGRMASGIVHDFNNMLAVVLGRVQMLSHKYKDEELISELETIEKVVDDSIETIRRLQDFTREREQKDSSTFKPILVNSLIQEVVEYSMTQANRIKEKHGYQILFEQKLEQVPKIFGDEVALRNALVNLLFNAIDALETGGVISVWTEQINNSVEIGVSDTGIGMSKEVMEKIFDPFFTTKGQRGNGLGLSEVYGIINQHQGKIEIESNPGEGTTVTIRFPIAQ